MPAAIERAVQACFSGHEPLQVAWAGAGDYCDAWQAGGSWMFLVAKHPHASACLDRLARVTPLLAGGAPLPLPIVEHHGQIDGLTYVGYRVIPGQPIGRGFPAGIYPESRQALIRDLTAFFRHLHGFDTTHALSLGVPQSNYPFCMRDSELLSGTEEELYQLDIEAFRAWSGADLGLIDPLRAEVDRQLNRTQESPTRLALLHNEVSGDHVMVGSRGEITGVIDFNGMMAGRPERDFLYLYEELGPASASELIEEYGLLDPVPALEELRFLHLWHTLARLLWAAEHTYLPGMVQRQGKLQSALQSLLR